MKVDFSPKVEPTLTPDCDYADFNLPYAFQILVQFFYEKPIILK